MVTSHDVARLAGVSQATVSRALSSSQTAKISQKTRARVLAAVDELGYVPNAGAQALKTRRTNTVGVVVAELNNPFYSEVLDELTRVFSGEGLRVILWNAGSGSHEDALSAIGESAVDGVVFTAATASSPELALAVERQRPVVLINREVEGIDCDKVISDNWRGAASVAEFLVSRGRTNAALIAGSLDATTSKDRVAGFLQTMDTLGHTVPEHLRFTGAFSHDLAAQLTRRILRRGSPPDAIFCVNDNMAFGALDTLRELGLTSKECWVIGYDDVEMASWPSFDLTTVRQPSRAMAVAGARLLLTRIADPGVEPRTMRFPSMLIERGSTA